MIQYPIKQQMASMLLSLFFCKAASANSGNDSLLIQKELNAFIQQYVNATNSHQFANVEPLLLPNAVYWFNKSSSQGIAEIKTSFERTWSVLPDEVYGIEKVKWLTIAVNSATCIYEYTYEGTHQGKPVTGRGRGTSVLVKQKGRWLIAHEHLSIPEGMKGN